MCVKLTLLGIMMVLGLVTGIHIQILHGNHDGCRCVTREECGDGGGLIKPRVNGTECDKGFTYCCVILATPPPPSPLQCGTHEPISGFSSGVRNIALRDEFPWLVKILASDDSYLGSGVLIDEFRVLSVAHLYQNSRPASVVLGIDAKVVEVAKTVRHGDFNWVNLHNDIVILHLAEKLDLRSLYPRVGTVCLPDNEFRGRENCVLSTFGVNYHNVIRKIKMPILSGDNCEDRLRRTGKLGTGFLLNRHSFLCAGGTEQGQDACQGHGGSPLVCKVDGRYTLAGLVSWGLTDDCSGRETYPGAYLNVARYREWIDGKYGVIMW